MDVRSIGKWEGSYVQFDDFKEELFLKASEKFIKDEALVVFKNWHKCNLNKDNVYEAEGYSYDALKNDFADYISADKKENANKLFIVNYGWHHVDDENKLGLDVKEYLDKYLLCNTPIFRFSQEHAMDGEIALLNKDGNAIFSLYKDKELGFTVLWCLSDAAHLVGMDEHVKFWEEYLLKAAISAGKCGVFLDKYSKMEKEGKKNRFEGEKFLSVYQKASEIYDSDDKKESIIKEMLDKVDYNSFCQYLSAVYFKEIGNVKYINKDVATEWLKRWAENKWQYYVAFGNKFSIEQPIKFEMDYRREEQIIKGLILDIKKQFPKYALILANFSSSEIFENKVSGRHESLAEFSDIKSGMKVTKYISALCQDNEFDTALSAFIQQKLLESIIHISIDPMDYVTMSDNKHGWDSCHSLLKGGCNGVGSCSYMFDDGSLVAYLASDKKYEYQLSKNSFKWNSKAWRQIVYSNPKENNFVFTREYPQDYHNGDVSNAVRELLESKISEFCQIPNIWIKKENGAKNKGVYQNAESAQHYDDVGNGREHVYIKHAMNKSPKTIIRVGFGTNNPLNGKTCSKSSLFS